MKIGFLGLLTIVLVVLKATGYLTWNWLWVFSPMWVPAVAVLSFIFIAWTFVGILWIMQRVTK